MIRVTLVISLLLIRLLAHPASACDAPDAPPPLTVLTDPARQAGGAPLDLAWSGPPTLAGCAASYLVIGLPTAVRFEGDGFIALAPGERAPFDIGFAAARMRAVVPLHLAGNSDGRLRVLPYVSGAVRLDWAIVAVPTPGQPPQMLAQGSLPLQLAPGRPRVIVQDSYSTERPHSQRSSPDGTARLDIFDGWFRLVDSRTGALILTAEGREPRFSPTGRFVHAFGLNDTIDAAEASLPTDLRLYDVLAERQVARIWQDGWPSRGKFITALHWSPGDSFLAVSFEAEDGMGFLAPLTDRPFHQGQYGCGACDPADEGLVDVSPENALVRIGSRWSFHQLGLTDRSAYWQAETQPDSEWEYEDGPPPEAILRDPGHRIAPMPSDPLVGQDRDTPMTRYLNLDGPARASWEWSGAASDDEDPPPATPELFASAAPEVSRAGVALAAAGRVAAPSRRDARLAAIGLVRAATPPLAHAVIAAVQDEDPQTGGRRISYPVGRAAAGTDAALAQRIDQLVTDEIRFWNACSIAGSFRDADLWTLRHRGRIVQLLHYDCTVSTGYGPEGLLLRIDTDPVSGKVSSRALRVGIMEWTPEDSAADAAEVAEMERRNSDLPVAAQMALRLFRLDDSRLAILDRRGSLVIYDLDADRATGAIPDLPAATDVEDIGLLGGGLLLQMNRDGRFFLHDPDRVETLLAGRYLDDEVVVYDADLRFEATTEGARHVALKYPGDPRAYRLDQFGAVLAGGGVVRAALDRAPRPPAPPPPVPPRLELIAQTDRAVRLKAEAGPGEALARIDLLRDGALIDSRSLTGSSAELDFDLPALPETRGFALSVTDARGLVGQGLALPRHPGSEAPRGRLHVLAVGTDIYDDPAITRLGFAVRDARNLARGLAEGASRYYARIDTEVLANDADLARDLPARLAALRQAAGPEDTLILHVAGHGLLDGDGRFYLATRSSRSTDLVATGLAWDRLAAELAAYPGRVLVLLDACHSGAAGQATNDDAVGALLSRRPGLVVLSASKGRQESLESAAAGGGLFTSAVVAALTVAHDQTDSDGNGTVELTELYARVKRDVVTASRGRQTPWLARSTAPGGMPVF